MGTTDTQRSDSSTAENFDRVNGILELDQTFHETMALKLFPIIKSYVTRAGLTNKQIALQCDIALVAVEAYFLDGTNRDNLSFGLRLCRALGIDLDWRHANAR